MIIRFGDISVECRDEDEEFVRGINLNKINEEIKDYFDYSVSFKIDVILVYSIGDFEKYSGRNFERWNCAFVSLPNKIYILSPAALENFTSHRKEDYASFIAHFFYHLKGFGNVALFNEGLATYLGSRHGSDKYERLKEESSNVFVDNLSMKEGVYLAGFKVIDNLIERFGKQVLFDFLSKIQGDFSEDELRKSFHDSFKISFEDLGI